MKRYIASLLVLLSLLLGNVSVSYALDGVSIMHDTRYELCYAENGRQFYVEKESITPILYNPPYYTIQANFVFADNNNSIRYGTCRISFDLSRNMMTLIDPKTRAPLAGYKATNPKAKYLLGMGNYMFRVCYGRDFY